MYIFNFWKTDTKNQLNSQIISLVIYAHLYKYDRPLFWTLKIQNIWRRVQSGRYLGV